MKVFVIFAAFVALCSVSLAQSMDTEDKLRTALNSISVASATITVDGDFAATSQISNTTLDGQTINIQNDGQNRTITSQVTALPLFSLGGTDLDLSFSGISLTDNTGKGLISLSKGKLTINGGTYERESSLTTYSSLIKTTDTSNAEVIIGNLDTPYFNSPKVLDITGGTLTVSSWGGSITSLEPLIITSGTEITIGSVSDTPSFSAPRVFDITGGKLDFIRGSFTYTSSSTIKRTQIKATNADVNIGYEHATGPNLVINQLTFEPKSSAVVLQSCKTVVIQQVTFDRLQLENDAGYTNNIYQTPALVVYASADTSLTIQNCIFSRNTYSGQEITSGAVFIQFPRAEPSGTKPSVLIQDTSFTSNTGTSSGAITFINKGVKTITFTRVEFTGNTFSGSYPTKANGIFATDNLNDKLGANPFSSCYATYSVSTPFGNEVPFYQSLEGQIVLPFLQDKQKTVTVQTDGTGADVYDTFSAAATAIQTTANSNGKIILKGTTFTHGYFVTINNLVTITPEGATKPTIYNQITVTSNYAFYVQSTLTMNNFNIVQGDATGSGYGSSTSQFFYVNGGILKISDIQFTTKLATDVRTGSFINIQPGGFLYVDRCSFSGKGFAQSQCAVKITQPQTIEIKSSTFDGNTADYEYGAAAVMFSTITTNSQITITGNTFKNNGPYSSTVTGYVQAGAIYIGIYQVPAQIINLQGNTFTNNVGRSAGDVYISLSGTLYASQLSLAGSTFSGKVIDVYRSSNYAYLYGLTGIIDYPLEVTSTTNLNEDQRIIDNYISTNPTSYKFGSLQAALAFYARYYGKTTKDITIIDTVTNTVATTIGANFIIQGKKSITDLSTQGTLQIGNAGQLTFSNFYNQLRWLNLVRTSASSVTNLVIVTQGDLTIDGCSFSDSNTASTADFVYILISTSFSTTTIQNCVFNQAKFGAAGAAISKSNGTLTVEKCTFNGLSTQTGPFLSISGNGDGTNTIKSSVFSGAGFSAVVISTASTYNLNYNVFTGITKGYAISIDAADTFTVSVLSNDFNNNGDIVSSSAGTISIGSTVTYCTLTAQYNLFTNNKGTNAGAIYSATTNSPTFNIQYNYFSGNQVKTGGIQDINIISGIVTDVRNNIRRGGSDDYAKGPSGTIANAYISKQSYPYRSEVHVQSIGVNGIGDVVTDEGTGTGAIDNPLKTIDFAVNSRSTNGDLNVVLYRQEYSIYEALYILGDKVTISDSDECSSPYYKTDKSIVSIPGKNYYTIVIQGGSLILNSFGVESTITSNQYPFILITEAGSFEAKDVRIVTFNQNTQLIQSTQAITSFRLTNVNTVPYSTAYSDYSLIDLTLNSGSTFEISDSTLSASYNLRYALIKVESQPAVFSFNHVTFGTLGSDTTAKVVQIYGAAIVPEEVFDHCTVSATTAPLLQIPGESYSGQYDGVLLTSAQNNNLGTYSYLSSYILQSSISITERVTYVGQRFVFQLNRNDYLSVSSGGHLTVRGVTFIQQPRGESIIYSSTNDASIVLEDVGFLVATQQQIATGLGFLHSSDLREDLESINKKKQKINIDYYLKSLQKTSHSQILTQPFIDIQRGYSLTLSSIRFGDWIATDDTPLIRSVGAIQHAFVENIQVSRVGRRYGGPYILDLNLRPSGEAVIRNVTIDGRGWVHSTEQPYIQINPYQYINHGEIVLKDKCEKEIDTEIIEQLVAPDIKLDISLQNYWDNPAIKVKGGKLRMSDTTFIGLGVDGALLLEDVEADLANSTRFEENDVYSAAKAEGRKKLIPSEIESVSDEEDSDEEYDETDRRIRELRRYPDYIKNVIAIGKTTLRAWNVSFIGEKLAKKKTAYKAGYPLWIQHEREVQLVGEVGQSNNAFGVPDIKYVKSVYVDGADKDLGNGKIEKTVETEIRTKGLLIPGVEWFLELKNKKDPEENPRIYHYSLLHSGAQGWNELSREKLLGWYISEDENKLKEEKKSATSNSYYESQFGGKVLVRWVSQSVILLRFAHIEPKPEEKANADEAPADPDADRYIKDWEFRLGVEKRADQETIEPDPDVKWTNLKKIPFPVWAIVLIVVLVVLLIAAIIVAIILFFVCRKQKVGSSDGVEMNSDK